MEKQIELLSEKLKNMSQMVHKYIREEKNANDYLCLLVLEDDLDSLVEECEEYKDYAEVISPTELISLESRCKTIFDEISLTVCKDNKNSLKQFPWKQVVSKTCLIRYTR